MTTREPPIGLKWRSNTLFILTTVGMGMFTDMFLYGLIVPVLPFILKDRLEVPHSQIQTYVSVLLACYAGAQVVFSLPLGFLADKISTRQVPFLIGLTALLASTILLYLGEEIWVLIVARILQGISASVVWTIGMAMVTETVGSDKLGVTIGTIFGIISVGELAAPVLGGIVYKKAGSGAVFGMGFGLIAIDFAMRIVVIEKKVADRYGVVSPPRSPTTSSSDSSISDEETPLLNGGNGTKSEDELEKWIIPSNLHPFLQRFPILYAFSNPRLLTASLVAFMQASLLAVFDATIPLEAWDLFGFDSLKSGLLFIPLVLPYLVLGPICGRLVDKYGVKPLSTLGFAYAVIPLILLRLPKAGGTTEIVKFSVFLGLCSVGLAAVSAISIVESSYVIERYHLANKDLFGKEGPYAQLYAVNSVMFSAGLAVGPLVSGYLRERIGYGNMNAVVAVFCALGSLLSFVYLGGKPSILKRKGT